LADAGDAERKPLVSLLAEPGVVQRIACAAFAWAVTVAPAVVVRSGTWPARIVAVFAFLAGVAGPVLAARNKRVGRHLGISAFLALTTGVWLLSPRAIGIEHVDPVLSTIGAVAWGVFAFSWGEPWRMRDDADAAEPGALLRARAELPVLSVPIAALGVISALVLLLLAFRVRDPSRALPAQAAGIGLGVALVTAAANLAVNRGKARATLPTASKSATRAVLMLVVVAFLGGVALILRSRG
jgi:hypothetical protein